MTPVQRGLARHALGLPHRSNRSWRNHFVADEGSDDCTAWEGMVDAGLACRHKGSPLTGGAPMFSLTRAGAERAIGPREGLSDRHFPNLGQD